MGNNNSTKQKFKFPSILKSLEELPEAYRPIGADLYEKEGDEFIFQGFDESEAKKKVDEFRTRNRSYFNRIKELEALETKFKDVDPEKYQQGLQALQEMDKLKDKELLDKGQFEELLKKRTEERDKIHQTAMKAKDDLIGSLSTERDNYKRELDGLVIDGLVSRVVSKVGTPKKGALPHLLDYGRKVWKLNREGKAQAHHPGSNEPWYGKDTQPIGEDEWGAKLLEECNFMFEPGKGGESKGGSEDEGVRKRGDITYIDRNNPTLMAKYAKEILAGTVVAQ